MPTAADEGGVDLSWFDFGESEEASMGAPKDQTREQMLKRHRQEEQQIRTEAKAKKHAIPKGDRPARLEADAELEAALAEMAARHAQELAAYGPAEALSEPLAALSVSAQTKPQSKGHKRRQKKASQEAERERRMAQERSAAGPSAREVEMEKLVRKLAPLKLAVHEIPADGHCLYRSVAHQLQLCGDVDASFQECRRAAAVHIRTHAQDFLPYLAEEMSEDMGVGQIIEAYCSNIEGSSEWGGQLEITAISQSRRCCIAVYSADAPVLLTGEEFDEHGPRLNLSYHRHYYGLGEHYNSLVPSP